MLHRNKGGEQGQPLPLGASHLFEHREGPGLGITVSGSWRDRGDKSLGQPHTPSETKIPPQG